MSAHVAPARRRSTRPLIAGLCTLAALGLTACGPGGTSGTSGSGGSRGGSGAAATKASGPFADLSGPQILNKAIKATKTASSVTLDMDVKNGEGPMKAYLALNTKGECAGTITMGTAGTMELIKTGDKAYFRVDEAFLRSENKDESPEETEAILKELKGRWMKSDASDPETKKDLEMCELDTMLAEFETGLNFARKGEETTVDGRKALKLTESDGKSTTTSYVATEGEPYLLKIVIQGGDEPGTILFRDYNKPVVAKAPAAKDVLDLDA
ncbi:hypothetical protein ACFPM3_21540 [Streptomyces coeruleoprunus]|uniref:Lipoprotein n=1 Tax=Streptomyces coeruleoprunus TaxID=285563 RepID=A0ABV9XMG0_9ACTN